MQAFLATKKWLENLGVLNPDSKKWGGNRSGNIGSRQIAEFLSKDGKTVDRNEVNELLNIGENLPHPSRNFFTMSRM